MCKLGNHSLSLGGHLSLRGPEERPAGSYSSSSFSSSSSSFLFFLSSLPSPSGPDPHPPRFSGKIRAPASHLPGPQTDLEEQQAPFPPAAPLQGAILPSVASEQWREAQGTCHVLPFSKTHCVQAQTHVSLHRNSMR